MPTIRDLNAREILDSRGNPTVEVSLTLRSGQTVHTAVPSGASTGSHEALELRDGDRKRFGGKGVRRAVRNVRTELRTLLRNRNVLKQTVIDRLMIVADGTSEKRRLGANAILGVSLAVAHAAAVVQKLPLYASLRRSYADAGGDRKLLKKPHRIPRPMMNVVNGGVHAEGGPDAQEFMLLPDRGSFAENLRLGSEVFHALKAILRQRGFSTLVGDEGGFAPAIRSISQVLQLLTRAVRRAGYRPGRDVRFGLDVASSELFDAHRSRYVFKREGKTYTRQALLALYTRLSRSFPLESIEDGFAEDDWSGWEALTDHLGPHLALVGDDLFVTSVKRLQLGVSYGAANALLVKPNQVGTLTETFEAMAFARKHGFKLAISNRSGETIDTTIADLAVAANAEYLKAGSLSRGERLAKYNRLLTIEAELRQR